MERGDGIVKALELYRKCPNEPGTDCRHLLDCPLAAPVEEGLENPKYCAWLDAIDNEFN